MSKKTLTLALALYLSGNTLMASSDTMAQSLMKLRAEVEQLDTRINDEKDRYKSTMKSLVMQKNELDATVARQNLKIKQIETELSKVKKEVAKNSQSSKGLKPVVLNALDQLQNTIKTQIPFKTRERLKDLEALRSQLENDLITPQKALAMLWSSYDDAIRMTKENGLFKQTITLDGKKRLAQVARIGTVMMFFKTPDNEVGYVSQDDHGWVYTQSLDAKEQDEIITLFDAFKKQIRSGYFTLPNALVSMEVR